MKYNLVIILFFLFYNVEAQKIEQLIIGDWVEVRREYKNGHQDTTNVPNMALSFRNGGIGVFGLQLQNYSLEQKYTIKDKNLNFGIKMFEIESTSNDTLKLITEFSHEVPRQDYRCTFIRKSAFEKLTKPEVIKLNALKPKEKVRQDSVARTIKPQEENEVNVNEPRNLENPEIDYVYNEVNESPKLPKEIDFSLFIEKNLNYPSDSIVNSFVYVSFTVERNGEITDVIPWRTDLGLAYKNEAVRVVKLLPKWSPGKVNGKSVRTKANLRIRFTNTD